MKAATIKAQIDHYYEVKDEASTPTMFATASAEAKAEDDVEIPMPSTASAKAEDDVEMPMPSKPSELFRRMSSSSSLHAKSKVSMCNHVSLTC